MYGSAILEMLKLNIFRWLTVTMSSAIFQLGSGAQKLYFPAYIPSGLSYLALRLPSPPQPSHLHSPSFAMNTNVKLISSDGVEYLVGLPFP